MLRSIRAPAKELGWVVLALVSVSDAVWSEIQHPVFPVAGSFEATFLTEYSKWGFDPDSEVRDSTRILVDRRPASELASMVECGGSSPPVLPKSETNHKLIFVLYALALRYGLEGNLDDADTALVLLERFLTCFKDHWQLQYPGGSSGIWDPWSQYADNDAGEIALLALSYDQIAPTISLASDRTTIEEGLLTVLGVHMQKREATLWNYSYFRPQMLAIYGRVLGNSKLVHLAIWLHSKMLYEEYAYDGMGSEGYSYSHQLGHRIAGPDYCRFVDGYSDPPGFEHIAFEFPHDMDVLENYSCAAHLSPLMERINAANYQYAYPNRHWPVIHETALYRDPTPTRAAPGPKLFGGFGHAILALGAGDSQTQVRFHFAATRSHHHKAAGHFMLYSQGRELIGGTAYMPKDDRSWNQSTANQNTVVLDGLNQKGSWFQWSYSWPYIPSYAGIPAQTASLVGQDRFVIHGIAGNRHNDLLLFDSGSHIQDSIQTVAVDLKDAYGENVGLYSRLLALVQIPGGQDSQSYLVDLFRVSASTTNPLFSYVLHGRYLPDGYSLDFPGSSLMQTSGSLNWISFIKKISAPGNGNIISRLSYPSGAGLRTHLLVKQGDRTMRGQAPSSRHNDATGSAVRQDYLVWQRAVSQNQETLYAAVHEPESGSPSVLAVQDISSADSGLFGVSSSLAGGVTDHLVWFPAFEEGDVRCISVLDLCLSGKFGYVRTRDGVVVRMQVVDGEGIEFAERRLRAQSGSFSYRGLVMESQRLLSGAGRDAVVVDTLLPAGGLLAGRTIILTWGNGWSWGYTVQEVLEDGQTVVLDSDPGFEFSQGSTGGAVEMLVFPAGTYPGLVSFLIQGVASYDETLGEHSTAPLECGQCGCSLSDRDQDGDLVPDCLDGCPQNPMLQEPGPFGCEVPTASPTATATATATPSPTVTITPTSTCTSTATVTPTATSSWTPTASPTSTSTPTASATPTATTTFTATATSSSTPTETASPTVTSTPTASATPTASPTITSSATSSATATAVPSLTATGTETATPAVTTSSTPTAGPVVTETATATATPTGSFPNCRNPETDSDFDGQPDCFDGCPKSPLKVFAGVCGCDRADSDANANGIIDCLGAAELSARIWKAESLLSELRRLKLGGRARQQKLARRRQRALILRIRSLAQEIVAYAQANRSIIELRNSSVNILALAGGAADAIRKALNTKSANFIKNKNQASESLELLNDVLLVA